MISSNKQYQTFRVQSIEMSSPLTTDSLRRNAPAIRFGISGVRFQLVTCQTFGQGQKDLTKYIYIYITLVDSSRFQVIT